MNVFKKIYWKTDMFLDDVAELWDKFKLSVWSVFAPRGVTYYYELYMTLRRVTDELEEQFDAETRAFYIESDRLNKEIAALKARISELESGNG